MKKHIAALLLATTAASSIASGGVGASNPNSATNENVVAVAETGASASWTSTAFEGKATVHEIAELNKQLNSLNSTMTKSIDKILERKVKIQTQTLFLN